MFKYNLGDIVLLDVPRREPCPECAGAGVIRTIRVNAAGIQTEGPKVMCPTCAGRQTCRVEGSHRQTGRVVARIYSDALQKAPSITYAVDTGNTPLMEVHEANIPSPFMGSPSDPDRT